MKKRITAALCALSLMPLPAALAAAGTQAGPVDRVSVNDGYKLNTPEENIFRIDGSEKEFILLDSEDGFYVLAKEQYGKRAFDPDGTQKFDPDDSNNMAYWLNHDFLEKGNGTGNRLPEEIIKYIDNDREWFTEAGISNGNCPVDYTVNCGVTLLSQTEWIKYNDKFGVADDIGVYGWWLRTARGKNGTTSTVLCSMTTVDRLGQTFGQTSSNANEYYVRPAFYLKDEFFKEVKLDKIGNNVGEALAKKFDVSDFQGEGTLNYEDKLLRTLGFDIPFEIDDGVTKVSADILKGEYNTKLSGDSTEQKIVCGGEQFIKTGYAVDARRNYELVLKAGLDSISKNDGVTLSAEYFDEKGKKCDSSNEILKIGGTRQMQEYVANLVSIPDNTEFVVFTLSFEEGLSGTVFFESLSLREIKPVVTLSNDWEPTYIIDPDLDFYTVRIECNTDLPKNFNTYYTLSYTADDYFYESTPQKLQLSTNGVGEYKIEMKNLHRGNAQLNIYVKYGNNTISSFSHEVSVTKIFDTSKDNGLLRHGICIHPAQIERSKGVILDYAKQAGFNYVRGDFSWERLEKGSKGAYDYSALDYIVNEIDKRDMELLAILCYSNKLYTSNSKAGIADGETMDAFLNYVKAVAKRYPQIKYFEVWNEPNNNGFWYPKANVNDYANLVKAVSRAIKEVRPDAYVVGGAIDISKNGPGWSRELFDLDIYPYIDAFSTHPYYHTALNDDKYLDRVKNYTDIIEDYGGWKDVYLTEAGWTTYGKKELEPTLASEDVKVLVHADYLDTRVNIFNMWDEGETFGLLNPDYSAKASFSAVANYENNTAEAQFVTKINLDDDCHTFLYRKKGMPMLISWCCTGEEKTLEFDKSVTAYDMYGNLVSQGNKVKQTDEPYYIYSSDLSLLANGVKSRIADDIDSFTKKYGAVLTQELKDKILTEKDKFKHIEAASVSDVNSFYDLGVEIMESLGDELFKKENTNMMYQYNKIALEAVDFLSLAEIPYENSSIATIEEAEKSYSGILSDAADTKRFSCELLRNARKYSELAADASKNKNVEKGIAYAYDAAAANLAKWAKAVMNSEESENIGVHFQAIPGIVEAYEGESAKLSLYAYNSFQYDAEGSIKVTSSDGEILSKKDNVKIPAGGKALQELTLALDGIGFGEDELTVSFEGNVNASVKIKANIKSKIDITLKNSEVPTDEIKSLAVELENKTEGNLSGKVKIIPPEGWSVGAEQTFDIGAAGKSEIVIPVAKAERTAFNCYMFTIEVTDNSGNMISRIETPLDFSVIVKSDTGLEPSEFDGDISEWSNAYPTYLNVPKNPQQKSEWENSDLAARIFTKWDDSYFYILADIYDDYQNQMNHEGLIYDGDSLQIAFDTLNTKNTKYDADDYEYGFALTLTGEESYSWQSAEGKTTGVKPSEWCRVLRDDENKNTRYLIRIPKAELEPMKFSEGSVIGFNIVANDGNLLGPREGYAEITPGIASSKNTSLYRNWTLAKAEDTTDNGLETVSGIFSVKMGEVNTFSDIKGHWSESYVNEAYSRGLIKGMGNNTFAPDSELTVAQGLSLIARTLDIEDFKSSFSDVSDEAWYSGAIGGMEKAGLIPEAMVKDGKIEPERIITREELAAVIAGAVDTEATLSNYPFNDAQDISAWAWDAVLKAAENGIMIGDDNNNFNPKGGLTRAEMAVIILKLIK